MITIQNLTYTYMKDTPYEKKALDKICLTINKGEFIGLIGHTGSGKSTLIQHLNGILKPMEGTVIVDGINTVSKGLSELRKKVGLVFQYPEYQLFAETVYEDIAFGLKKQGAEKNVIDKRVKEVAKLTGLSDKELLKSPFELSGGQKRRAAIAGILVLDPQILVLDEPAAGLDPAGREEILSIFKGMHDRKGITIILVSHSMENICRFSSRVIVMNKGKIEMNGKPEEIFNNIEQIKKIGLGVPDITSFMKGLKEKIPQIPDNLLTINDAKNAILKLIENRRKS